MDFSKNRFYLLSGSLSPLFEEHVAFIDDARVLWDEDNGQPYADIFAITGIQFQRVPLLEEDYTFDFCVEDLRAFVR
jgi:hypothetical protein